MDSRVEKFQATCADYTSFSKRVGRVMHYFVAEFLGLEPDSVDGSFSPKRISSLIEFCESNPEYHIISSQGFVLYNKYIPDSNFYFIGDGDSDHNLTFDLTSRLSINNFLQVGHAKFAPVTENMKNRQKA
jgi:hypothetical protein